jgi:membrane protein
MPPALENDTRPPGTAGSGESSAEVERGRQAEKPSEIPAKGWRDILWRVWHEVQEDRVMLVAAGATFYLLLALFPALTAFVSLYGFVADPANIAEQIAILATVMPAGGLDIIRDRLESLASQPSETLSISFVVALLFAFWSANNGIKVLFEAINIAYEETEKRSFLKLNLLALSFTLGAMVVAIALISAVAVVPAVIALFNLDAVSQLLIQVLRWPLLLVLIAAAISLLYRYGPSRERAKWRWVTWGSIGATVVWLAASVGFSFYLSNFANYEATYGSLGAVIGFMMWTWISVITLIMGAQINAEMEHQTTRDSTTGEPKPMGQRGAVVADTVGKPADE